MTDTDQPNTKRRLPRWVKVSLTCVSLVFVLLSLYLWEAYRYYHAKPAPIVDAYAVFNARNDGYTENEKAWTVYYDVHYNHWTGATDAIDQKMHAILEAERAKEAEDLYYDAQNPFTSNHNMFGIPPEHELYADVAQLAHDYRPHIDRIREATARPVFGRPITDKFYESSEFTPDWLAAAPTQDPLKRGPIIGVHTPGLGITKTTAVMLELDAQIAADAGDFKRTTSSLRAMMQLSRQASGEPGMLNQLMAISAQQLVNQRIIYLISRNYPSTDIIPLFNLRDDLLEAYNRPIQFRIEDIRLENLDMLGHYYSGNGSVTPQGLAMRDGMVINMASERVALALLWPARWLIMDRAESVEHLEAALAPFDTLQATGPFGIAAFRQELKPLIDAEINGSQPILQIWIWETTWMKAVFSQALSHASLAASATLLALEHHRLDTGTYPDTLTDLIPTYLDAIPQDPFDPGRPIKYRLIDNIPHLYSVGSDGDDDLARRPNSFNPSTAHDFELRFANPARPSPNAPDADWVIYPPSP
jgi:hypothetical protein